jgi:hypothetical protein
MTGISNGLRLVTWKDAAWSAEDFRAVLRSIVSSPHVAVPVPQLEAVLGEGGAAKLESMNAKKPAAAARVQPPGARHRRCRVRS